MRKCTPLNMRLVPEKGLFNVCMNYMYYFVDYMKLYVFLLFSETKSSLDMDLQVDALDLMAKEDISYKDGLHLDQELSQHGVPLQFADFNFRETFLSKGKF